MNKYLLTAALLLGLSSVGSAQVGSKVLVSGDGSAEAFVTVSSSATAPVVVPFSVEQEQAITSVQIFGNKAADGGSLTVTLTNESGLNQKVSRPLVAIPAGRNTWHSVTFIPSVKVSGAFAVSIAVEGAGSFQLGSDQGAVNGVMDGESVNAPLVRVTVRDPSYVPPARPAPQPKAAPAVKPSAPADKAAAAKPGSGKKPMVANAPAAGSFAYRAPNRKLSYVKKAPAIPRGSGRVDVSWNTRPATVELNYVGKPARILENLDVQRLVVDFPVPEPGLFNVVIRKPGYKSEARQFRIVAGGRQEWKVTLVAGADDTMQAPMMENVPPADNGMEPIAPVIDEDMTRPAPDAGGNQPPPQGPPPGFENNPPSEGPGARPNNGGPGAGNRPPRGNRPPGDSADPGYGNNPNGNNRGNRPPRGNRGSSNENPREGMPAPPPPAPAQ